MVPEHPVPQYEPVGAERACPKNPKGPELGQGAGKALSALPSLVRFGIPVSLSVTRGPHIESWVPTQPDPAPPAFTLGGQSRHREESGPGPAPKPRASAEELLLELSLMPEGVSG